MNSGIGRLRGAARHARRRLRRAVDASSLTTRTNRRTDVRDLVISFDAWQYLVELESAVTAALAAAQVEHLVLPGVDIADPVVAIRREDARHALAALAGHPATSNCRVTALSGERPGRQYPLSAPILLSPVATGLLITRHLVAPSGVPLVPDGFGVLLDLWQSAGPDASGPPSPGTLATRSANSRLNRVSAQVWSAAQHTGHRLPQHPPPLLAVTEPIDLVYTWVDGSDPAWQARMHVHRPPRRNASHSADAAIAARFHNRDELRYSLRSVQQYANWANRIWLVTDRQVPSWLVPDDRLVVVDHTEIFRDQAALPSFNSHAIESQLHHLAGLAEHYLYLNDDVLFARPLRPEAFFHGNGLSKFFPSPALISPFRADPGEPAVDAAAKNNRAFIETRFGRGITNKMRHAPIPQSRALMQRFEDEHPDLFDAVMRSRFRHRDDVSLVSALGHYYGFALGRAVPGRIANGYVDLASPVAPDVLLGWLRRHDRDVFCLNDSGGPAHPSVPALLERFLTTHYPLPSRWERTDIESAGLPEPTTHPSAQNEGTA